MAGSSNFLQWNSGAVNQESDAQYSVDAMRLSGASSPSLFASSLANKLFYQLTIFIAAMAQMLADKGYVVSDANFNTLKSVLANILTFVDVPTIFTSPAFTGNPTAPTQAAGDSSTRLATTAFVRSGQTPRRTALGGNVTLTANVVTNIIAIAVTFPAGSGTYRADMRYTLWAQIGSNAVAAEVVDSLGNHFAASGHNSNGSGFEGLTGAEISAATYAAGAVVTFTLKAVCNAGGTATPNSGLFGGITSPSFLEVTPISAT